MLKNFIYKFVTVCMTVIAAMSLTMTCNAMEADGESEGEYENVFPSAEEMIYSLYENETDQIIRSAAISGALLLTGNKEPLEYYTDGSVLIEKYSVTSVRPEMQSMVSLLGAYQLRFGTINGKYAIFTASGEPLTEEAFARNNEDLKKIYTMVTLVKNATAGIDDVSKLTYIENIVKAIAPTYVGGTECVIARTLEEGYCDCDGYSQLTYLLGLNCGLDIRCIFARSDRDCHEWNELVIDGVTYWHDTTWDLTARTDKYFLVLPGSPDMAELQVVTDSKEVSTSTKIQSVK